MGDAGRLRRGLRRVLSGYRTIGVGLLQALALALGALLVGIAIVGPLWLAATRATPVYTAVVLGVAGGGLLVWIFGRIRRASAGSFRPILKVAARVIGILAGLYAMTVLFALGLIVPAAAIALAGLVWLGYAASGGRTTRHGDGAR